MQVSVNDLQAKIHDGKLGKRPLLMIDLHVLLHEQQYYIYMQVASSSLVVCSSMQKD